MEIKLNRRIFLAALGVTSATALISRKNRQVTQESFATHPDSGTLHFFADACPEPTAQPRSSAIRYLPTA